MKRLISVVIPVYNAEKYIERCLNSILGQTHGNLEIIIIDDGSTDNSPEICDKYATSDERIKVIHKYNEGVSTARNMGLSLAKGDYISFVDSDDWLESDAYELLMDCIAKHETDSVIFEYFVDYENGKSRHKNHKNIEGPMNDQKAVETTISPISRFVVAKIFSKSLVENIKFEKEIPIGEDTLFSCHALSSAGKVYYLAKPLYHYTQSENSATRCAFSEKTLTGITAYKKIVELCESAYPEIVGIAWLSYLSLVSSVLCRLLDNRERHGSKILRRNLTREVRKNITRVVFFRKGYLKLQLRTIVCAVNPEIFWFLRKIRHGK